MLFFLLLHIKITYTVHCLGGDLISKRRGITYFTSVLRLCKKILPKTIGYLKKKKIVDLTPFKILGSANFLIMVLKKKVFILSKYNNIEVITQKMLKYYYNFK